MKNDVGDCALQSNVVVDEDFLLSDGAREKICKIYESKDENDEIMLSIIRRGKLYPSKISSDQFIEVCSSCSVYRPLLMLKYNSKGVGELSFGHSGEEKKREQSQVLRSADPDH